MDANTVDNPGSNADPTATLEPHDAESLYAAARTGYRALRAQAVIDIAEDCRQFAARRGSDPLDDMLDLYSSVSRDGARDLVADAIRYLRAETTLQPLPGKATGGTMRYLGRAAR